MSDYLTIADLGDLYIATFDARIKWRNFLLVLKIPSDTIDSIGTKWRDDPDDCYREGLKEWLKGSERRWEDVVKALSSPIVGHVHIANTIEKDHLQSTDASNPTDVKSEVDQNCQKINNDLTVFLDEPLGKGAFGAVFKGSYKGEICAVKVLLHDAMEMQASIPIGKNEEASNAIDRESDFLKSFQHPNVVQFLSTAKHPKSGSTILVVELMDCNLRSYFSGLDEESLTSECEISLSKDMACGLAYIHSKQIIHRDLCGDNVLLKLTRPVPVAKISDFGMSRLYDPSKLSHTLTAIGHRMGYLPLEAIRLDKDNYDDSLDVFSLGVIMVQIVRKLKTIKSVEDRSFHVAQIPHTHRLRKLIDSCLQEDMRRRPSARDIYADLTRGLDTVEATKRESKDAQPVKKAHREHKDAELVRRDAIIQHTIMEDVCKKTGVRDQQLDQEIPESDIILIADKFPHLLNVHKALTINDLQHVYEKLHESASPHWFDLGLALGLTHPDLTNIYSEHRGNNVSCLREMLAKLLSTQHVTWSDLSDALKRPTVDLINLADSITVNQSNLLDQLNLTPADRDDVTDVARRYGNQAGVAHALRMWQRVNPSRATFRALVEIAIGLRRGDTATDICRFIVDNTDRN